MPPILQRVAVLLGSLTVSSVVVFAFMAVLPGDPARVALGVSASERPWRSCAPSSDWTVLADPVLQLGPRVADR